MSRLTWLMIAPWLMLLGSNLFMTTAWYGHLRFKNVALPIVIFASWGVALFEYVLAVPANRIGSAVYTPSQLKVIQEAITMVVFIGFSTLYLGESVKLSTVIGFLMIFGGVAVVMLGK